MFLLNANCRFRSSKQRATLDLTSLMLKCFEQNYKICLRPFFNFSHSFKVCLIITCYCALRGSTHAMITVADERLQLVTIY